MNNFIEYQLYMPYMEDMRHICSVFIVGIKHTSVKFRYAYMKMYGHDF